MKLLVIHKYLGGQFRHLIQAISSSARHQVVCVGHRSGPEVADLDLSRYECHSYQVDENSAVRRGGGGNRFQRDVAYGAAVARQLLQLKDAGFVPDLILAHSGWGEPLFCKDVFPDTPLIGYFEFFYRTEGGEADFFPDQVLTPESRWLIRALNAGQLLSLVDCDAGVSPTAWQRNGFPSELRGKIQQIHEGVDLEFFKPARAARFALESGEVLGSGDEVVTYVSRSLEPFRGFPQFMQAVALLIKRRPKLQVLIAGKDEVTYSLPLPGGMSYREKLCGELDLDLSRVHFLGWVQGEAYRRMLQVSSVHVYLTPPFVLSWSFIEAMAAGCAVVGSDTAPVREVIEHGETGLLCDFFAPERLADTIESVLDHPDRMRSMRLRAREHVARHYDVNQGLARYFRLMAALTGQPVVF